MPRISGRSLLVAALGASVALNLLLGGLLAFGGPHGPRPPRGFDRMVARVERALPEADRPRFRAVIEADRSRYAGALRALREAGDAVDAEIAREPFDPAAMEAALGRWSDGLAAFNAAFAGTMVRAMGEVSPEGRARIAADRRRGS